MSTQQVQTELLADSAITTAKLADANVTAAKLASGAAASNVGTGGVSTAMLAAAAVTPAKIAQPLTQGTAVASTSGTSIDFTSIPSWVRRITIALAGVSTTSTADIIVQLGTAGGVQTTSYLGGQSTGNNAIVTSNDSNGFLFAPNQAAASVSHGIVTLVNVTGNTWAMTGIAQKSDTTTYGFGAGSVALSGALTTVRITTSTGSPTFDAGSINILYE